MTIRPSRRATLAGLAAAPFVLGRSGAAVAQAGVDRLAAFPNGTFLENMLALEDGGVLFTSYFDRRVLRWSPGGGVSTFLSADAHPVSIAPRDGGLVVVAHTTTFDRLATVSDANVLLLTDRDGVVVRTIPVPGAKFLNGIEPVGEGRYLIADSILGVVWRVDLPTGTAEVWLRDEALAKAPGSTSPNPGVNGVKLSRDGWVHLSNSERTLLVRVRIDAAGRPTGQVETVATGLPGIDDFLLTPDGGVLFATHRRSVVLRRPDGTLRTVVEGDVAAGVTAVAFGRGPSAGFVFGTGTGALFEGGKGEAVLFRFPAP